MIAIVDYGMGNLRSVQKAFEQLGADAKIIAAPRDLPSSTSKLVLPGVGAFGDGMVNLRQRGWIEAICSFVKTGKPFLGICLGLQLLFEGSEEDAAPGKLVPGLGILPGSVVRFQGTPEVPRLKVPHMGWNTLSWTREDPLLKGVAQGAAVYFVHSYYAKPREDKGSQFTSATAEYPAGGPFCATLRRDNVWATQFHPEKSQRVGLQMLGNFAAM